MPSGAMINQLLAAEPGVPSDSVTPLSDDEVSDVFEAHVYSRAEEDRRDKAKNRQALLRDGGDDRMAEYIDQSFKDAEVRRLRKAWVARAKYNNHMRVVHSTRSTVYFQNAARTVAGTDNNARYQSFLRVSRFDDVMSEAHVMLNAHNDVFIRPRVRDEGFRQRPVHDVMHPGQVFVLGSRLDKNHLVGVGMYIGSAGLKPHKPHWDFWTSGERFFIDGAGHPIWETHEPHTFGRIPILHISTVMPEVRGMLLDGDSGDDVVAAHESIWLQEILLLKESKSASKQTAFSGDLSGTATGQSQDTEVDLYLGEGVNSQTLDRGMDLSQFRENADHIEERSAANYGIAPSILRQEGASSGHEIALRMLPLKMLREKQKVLLRDAERELVEIQSLVLAQATHPFSFSTEGWSIDFGEVQAPQSPQERNNNFETERRLGLTNTANELIRRDPDLDEDGAMDRLAHNVDIEIRRNELMRPMQAIAGAAPSNRTLELVPDPDGDDEEAAN